MQEDSSLLADYVKGCLANAPGRCQEITLANRNRLPFRTCFSKMSGWTDDFLAGKAAERFVVLTGLRGTGKTTIMAQLYLHLLERGVPQTHLLFANMDEATGLLGGSTYELVQAYEMILGRGLGSIDEGDKIFLFIDEAQRDLRWQLALKSAYDSTRKVFIVATGSSALALTATADIARRARMERLPPLSFREYLDIREKRKVPFEAGTAMRSVFIDHNDIVDVHAALDRTRKEWGPAVLSVGPASLMRYLRTGTLPFTFENDDDEQAFPKIVEMVRKVVYQDLDGLGRFDRITLDRTMKLLAALSVSDRVNYEGLMQATGMSRPSLNQVLEALEGAELLFKVWPIGSASSRIRRTPKYKLTSSALRASFLWSIGAWKGDRAMYGLLFEDVAAMRLDGLVRDGSVRRVEIDPDENGADFILERNDGRRMAIEVGFGKKGVVQVQNTMKQYQLDLGMVVSDRPLQLDTSSDILMMPRELFLLL
jgi:predicted AAA+ superfamily ATPase